VGNEESHNITIHKNSTNYNKTQKINQFNVVQDRISTKSH